MATQPQWLENAVFYEIYPQSFNDTNADGIGDIPGIIEKLDYIKELGANAIWMNPCFASPFNDAGYDVEDYYTVAPRYGTNEDLKHLFEQAHERGIRIILDLVPGHTSYTHKWFKESCKAEKNEYTDRYVWTDSVWNTCSGMNFLTGVSERDGAVAVNFFSTQPALNYGFYKPDPNAHWQQPMDAEGPTATRNEIKNIIRFWLGMGCDGFRVDMAGSLVKNDPDGKGTIAFWQDIRAFLDKEFPNAAFISEWGEPNKSLLGGFHMDFLLHVGPTHYMDLFRNEPFFSKKGKGSIKEFIEAYKCNMESTNGKGLICIPSSNHDMARISNQLDDDEIRVAFAFLMSMPGAPFIYYGDEIGMKYLGGIKSVEGGFGRTGSRSPMQWDNTVNAGFSTASEEKLYIPLDKSEDRPNAQNQMNDETSLRSEIKRLINLRKSNIALQASAKIEFITDGYPFVYRRSADTQTVTVIINPIDKQNTVENISGKIIYTVGGAALENGKCIVDGCSAVFIEQ